MSSAATRKRLRRVYDLRLLTVAQLRDQLRLYQLPLGGRKAELVERLERHLA